MIESTGKNRYILCPEEWGKNGDYDFYEEDGQCSLIDLTKEIHKFLQEHECDAEDVMVNFDHEDGLQLFVKD